MKKYFLSAFLLFSPLFAYPQCSPDLQPALQAIYQFPEGKKLVDDVEALGPIKITRSPFKSNSNAMWDSHNRMVVINANSSLSYGEIVRSIFFELHNAKTDSQFDQLDWLAIHHRISKSQYVESVERIEHHNAYSAAQLINKAIYHGYFPSTSKWPITPDFNVHFSIQKQTGHSGAIAAMYDALTRSTYYG